MSVYLTWHNQRQMDEDFSICVPIDIHYLLFPRQKAGSQNAIVHIKSHVTVILCYLQKSSICYLPFI